jgi:hypothetical protein
MDAATVLALVKERLGIKSTTRDTYLTAIINGVIKEVEDEKGLTLDDANNYHLMFAVDYATWRYQSRDSDTGMPRHLQFRLHNLMLHVGLTGIVVSGVEIVAALPVVPVANTVYVLTTDGSTQMYIDSVWTEVEMVDGRWAEVVV